MTNIERTNKEFAPEVKRLYATFLLNVQCAECEELTKVDLRDDYFYYPIFGAEDVFEVTCKNDHQTEIKFVLDVSLKIVE